MSSSRSIVESLALLLVVCASVVALTLTIFTQLQLKDYGDTLIALESRQTQTDQYLQATLTRLADGTPMSKQWSGFGVDRDKLAKHMQNYQSKLSVHPGILRRPAILQPKYWLFSPAVKLSCLALGCFLILLVARYRRS